jgi:phenylalanyl-tRNA synthetase beta chain
MHRPVDLIEEVGRHYGYEHLPSRFPAVTEAPPPSDPRIARDAMVRRALLGAGCSEAITFAFIEAKAAEPFLHGDPPVGLANPLSETFAVMRPSLLPGLVDAVSHNRRREQRDVRLFEIGTAFSPRGERRSAAVAWTGLATPDHWSGQRRGVDFYDLKGLVERVCADFALAPELEAATAPYLVDGRAAEVRVGGQVVGRLGQVDPAWLDARDLPRADEVYVAELDLDRLSALSADVTRRVAAPPRFPSSVRDVSILVDDTLSAATVRGTMRSAAPPTLATIQEFDRYQGKGVPDGKISLSLRLTFRAADRTLTDAEVQDAMQAIVGALVREHGAVQR